MTEPLTPPDCDLRDYPWMPVDCTRLLTSETWLLGTSDQKVAAFTLWAKSWHQVPAGSLPDNDRMLAILSEAGAAWKKVREHALRGWIKCSDGRLYHPVVCEKANESLLLKQKQKDRTRAAREAREAKRASAAASVTDTVTDDEDTTGGGGAEAESDAKNVTASYHYEKFSHSHSETIPLRADQVIENGSNDFLSQTLSQAPPDQTRPEHKERKKEKEISLPVPEPADVERAETAAAPQWPPPPLPSAIAATVGVLTAKLEGRHRDTKPPGPVAPRRTAEEQVAALGKPKLRAHYASEEALKRARAELALRAAPAEGNA